MIFREGQERVSIKLCGKTRQYNVCSKKTADGGFCPYQRLVTRPGYSPTCQTPAAQIL